MSLGTALKEIPSGLFLFFVFFTLPLWGQEVEDTLSTSLQEVEVSAFQNKNIRRGGSVDYNPDSFLTGIRVMGEADPLNRLKLLSGVRTVGDYGSGFMIDGNTPSQSLFRIDGVPVFFPYRFGGIFSTFNGPHFERMNFERGFHHASMPARLGTMVDFDTGAAVCRDISGVANVGMTSSAITMKVPIAGKVEIRASGRVSYIDEIYGRWLKGKDSDIKYRFWDANLTARWLVDNDNALTFNAFLSEDRLKYSDTNYAMDNHLTWGNYQASLSWRHRGNHDMIHRIYWSGFRNRFGIILPQASMKMPSDLSMVGASGDIITWIKDNSIKMGYGYELNTYFEDVGRVAVTGFEEDRATPMKGNLHPCEARIYADVNIPFADRFCLDVGLSAMLFCNSDGYKSLSPDPRLTLAMDLGPGQISAHFGRYSQYLHQVGFSQIGLASDFWISSHHGLPGESSYNFELDYTGRVSALSFSVTAYYKIVRNEPEYVGQILEMLDADYDPVSCISNYNGYNWGVRFNTNLAIGKFRAVVGGSYGMARRRDRTTNEYFRAISDPGFSLNADLVYSLNRHWEFGAVFRYSTGRPYTPAKMLYMIAGNIVTEYGRQNSALFPAIHQLDLSATWKTTSKVGNHQLDHLVNASLINAYGHKNLEIMSYFFDASKGTFGVKRVYSLYRFFPSVSYTIKF